MQASLESLLKQSIVALQAAGTLPAELSVTPLISRCRMPEHGDYASNIALILAKHAKQPPMKIAQALVDHLPSSVHIENIEVAAPGFINFRLAQAAIGAVVADVLQQRCGYGTHQWGADERVHVEFVSANPTGPLHVGHGRGAAFGACLVNILRACGYAVHAEYYVNDAGRQIRILALSVWLRYLALNNPAVMFLEGAYQGDYIKTIAAAAQATHDDAWQINDSQWQRIHQHLCAIEDTDERLDAGVEHMKDAIGPEAFQACSQLATADICADIEQDLAEFGVHYDKWFPESYLIEHGLLDAGIQCLRDGGYVYEKQGATWFRATDLGDEKDRVLIRDNGQPTYFASDVAYHLYKYQQGYTQIIDVFGADHHGYIARIKAFLKGLKQDPEKLHILLVQFAILYQGKEKISMSTRSGKFVTLRELRQEVGNDAARFFYIMRKPEQHLDFDLTLAKSQSQDNPVYYIQYAHARICSVIKQFSETGRELNEVLGLENLQALTTPHEHELLADLTAYPTVIATAAKRHQPHLLANYLQQLATHFHAYYNAERFVLEDDALCQARLCLIQAIKIVLINGLKLLGLSAPERM